MRLLIAQLLLALSLAAQQPAADPSLDQIARNAVIEKLLSGIQTGYVVPENAVVTIHAIRDAQSSGVYNGLVTAKTFAEKLTQNLRSASHDKHLAVFFDPESTTPTKPSAAPALPRERFNFGFNEVQRLRGNVGYLDLRSFANPDDARETASSYLSALANFDAIILDLRQNGGGNTPMVSFVASYFFSPSPVHLTDMYWRDQDQTIQVWTLADVPGRRSVDQDLYILVGPSTFSAAEDFSYSLKQLKRATLVGETTGGGAHMGRGLQRLSPLFTAFIPSGQSQNPITKSNWENVGVEPDVKVPVANALTEAHLLALRKLLEREHDPAWQKNLRQSIEDISAGK